MTELKHSPVPGIFCGLRMFVLCYSISLTVCSMFLPHVAITYAAPMLLLLPSFVVAFACAETVRSLPVNLGILALCIGADILMLPGLPLGPQITETPSAVAYIICIVLLVAIVIVHRTKLSDSNFSGVSFLAHMLILIALNFVADDSLRVVLYYAGLCYIPLSVASMFASSVTGFFDHLRGRNTQPLALFRRRLTSSSAVIILIMCAVLIMLPAVDFSFMNKVYGSVFLAIVKFLGMFTYVPSQEAVTQPEVDPYAGESTGSMDSALAEIIGYICIAVICICILEVLRRIVVKLIGVLRSYFSTDYVKTKRISVEVNKYDTIEKLEKTVKAKKRDKLTPAQTNAEKVRRIYKKRIESLLKKELGDLSSKAPDEITALVRENGYDISELTQLYKKARYSDNCEPADVAAARKIKAVKLPE